MATDLMRLPAPLVAAPVPSIPIPRSRAEFTSASIQIILRQARLIDPAEITALLATLPEEQQTYVRAFLDFRQDVDLLDQAGG